MSTKNPLILGIGGTTRQGSSSEKALTVCLEAARRAGVEAVAITGPELDIPLYAPEKPARSDGARRLIDLYRRCDGIVIASPSYHGGISGMVKNALDYTEDLSKDPRPYFDGCPVGLIACGAGWQGAAQALASLRSITHSLRGWPTPIGAMLNTKLPLFDEIGACIDASALFQLQTMAEQIMDFLRMKQTAREEAVA